MKKTIFLTIAVLMLLTHTACQDKHEYVDLGLPSGTLWAACNIGARAPEEFGDYFAWGETAPKDDYNWGNYKWSKGRTELMTKYCTKDKYGYDDFTDRKERLDPKDDAAKANWGSKWQIPTETQITELITECKWTWTEINEVKGCLVTGPNGNTIFLPATRAKGDDSSERDIWGCYWSNSISYHINIVACCMSFYQSGKADKNYSYRELGHTIRAVRVE